MRMSSAFLLPLWIITLGFRQESKPLADVGVATCESREAGGGMGKWITSSAGFSAAVEVMANVSAKGQQRSCTTSWILHVRERDGQLPIAIKVDEREDRPEDNKWQQENSFEIDAWSKDGKMILLSQVEAQGDWDETTPVIYDFISKKRWRIELYPLFKKMIPPDCYVVYRALRFSGNGKILISATSTDADDREAGTVPCFPRSIWKLDLQQRTVARLSTKSISK